ncbi:MAG: hypothetical protein AAF532_07740 [Planctomycetota bacterium]
MTLTLKPPRHDSDRKRAALEEATREETTRLNIMIPVRLHRALRLRAVDEGKGTTITALVTRALEEFFDGHVDDDRVI